MELGQIISCWLLELVLLEWVVSLSSCWREVCLVCELVPSNAKEIFAQELRLSFWKTSRFLKRISLVVSTRDSRFGEQGGWKGGQS